LSQSPVRPRGNVSESKPVRRTDCHGTARLAMTGMDGAAMPQSLVIASEARQSTGRMDCHGAGAPRNGD
ncbi:MAG: hypothetical protein LBP58_08595, partial [Azoarcus sp.]|nr:hypothetical protein [Azoarcus sp.]